MEELFNKEQDIREQIKGMSKEKLQQVYNADFKRTEQDRFDKLIEQPTPQRFKWLIEQLDPSSRVLDIGSGNGILCYHLVHAGHTPSGLDISDDAINLAKKNIPGLDVKVGNVEEHIPAEDGSFDYVISSQLVEHLKNPQKAITEMLRVCKKAVLFTTPIEKNLMDPMHLHEFDFYQICDLVEEACGHENFEIYRMNKFTSYGKKNVFGVKIFKEAE
jgi:2-polyprenyl-3-methyl-5-hydroxy-6-metoxy-1,4-benzoquinol methylase